MGSNPTSDTTRLFNLHFLFFEFLFSFDSPEHHLSRKPFCGRISTIEGFQISLADKPMSPNRTGISGDSKKYFFVDHLNILVLC